MHSRDVRSSYRQRNKGVIPPYKADPVFTRKLRYVATGALDGVAAVSGIERSDVLNWLAANLSGSTTWVRLCDAVRVKHVTIYGANTAATVPSEMFTVAIEWISSLGPNNLISDTGNAYSPPVVSCDPPKDCLAGFWSNAGNSESEVLFNLTVPAGAIVDVTIEFTLFLGAGTSVSSSGAGTLRTIAVNYLDGNGGGSGVLKPVVSQSNTQQWK